MKSFVWRRRLLGRQSVKRNKREPPRRLHSKEPLTLLQVVPLVLQDIDANVLSRKKKKEFSA